MLDYFINNLIKLCGAFQSNRFYGNFLALLLFGPCTATCIVECQPERFVWIVHRGSSHCFGFGVAIYFMTALSQEGHFQHRMKVAAAAATDTAETSVANH